MSSVLLPRLYFYGRRTSALAFQTRLISASCCRYQQAKAKSEQESKKAQAAKAEPIAATKQEVPLEKPSPSAVSPSTADVKLDKPVFKDNAAALNPPTPDGAPEVFSSKIMRLVDEIASLTLLEVADLNRALKKKLNLPDTPMLAANMVMPSAAAPGNKEEDDSAPAVAATKSRFTVKLTKIDDSKKIDIIKAVKAALPNVNLVQAKKLVESLPQTIKADIMKDEADALVSQLKTVGGICEIE